MVDVGVLHGHGGGERGEDVEGAGGDGEEDQEGGGDCGTREKLGGEGAEEGGYGGLFVSAVVGVGKVDG